MDEQLYDAFTKKSDAELFAYVTERESSQNRHVAGHILEIRRNEPLRRAAEQSADAAQLSAATAQSFLAHRAVGGACGFSFRYCCHYCAFPKLILISGGALPQPNSSA